MFSDLDGNYFTIRHNNSQQVYDFVVSFLEKVNATKLGEKLIRIAKNSPLECSIGFGSIAGDQHGYVIQMKNKDNIYSGYIKIDLIKHIIDGEIDEVDLIGTIANELSSIEDFFGAKDKDLYLKEAGIEEKKGYANNEFEIKSFEVEEDVKYQYSRLLDNRTKVLGKKIPGLSGAKVEDIKAKETKVEEKEVIIIPNTDKTDW